MVEPLQPPLITTQLPCLDRYFAQYLLLRCHESSGKLHYTAHMKDVTRNHSLVLGYTVYHEQILVTDNYLMLQSTLSVGVPKERLSSGVLRL